MKFQDISFLFLFVILLLLRHPKFFMYIGLIFIGVAIPLFGFQVFFTAERLTWYAAAFFATFIAISFFRQPKVQ